MKGKKQRSHQLGKGDIKITPLMFVSIAIRFIWLYLIFKLPEVAYHLDKEFL